MTRLKRIAARLLTAPDCHCGPLSRGIDDELDAIARHKALVALARHAKTPGP